MQNTARDDDDSLVRYGSGVLPDGTDTSMNRSPIINYPYAKMRPILERLEDDRRRRPRHGARLRYANPFNGGWSMPTMGAHLSLLPKDFKGKDYRSTDARSSSVVGRRGHDQGRRPDVRMGPAATCSWCRPGSTIRTSADKESVLFSISDRPAQEALGIWREGTADR